jgi:hypothetical protein
VLMPLSFPSNPSAVDCGQGSDISSQGHANDLQKRSRHRI